MGKVGYWLINGTIVDTEVQGLHLLESWLENSSHKVQGHFYIFIETIKYFVYFCISFSNNFLKMELEFFLNYLSISLLLAVCALLLQQQQC